MRLSKNVFKDIHIVSEYKIIHISFSSCSRTLILTRRQNGSTGKFFPLKENIFWKLYETHSKTGIECSPFTKLKKKYRF